MRGACVSGGAWGLCACGGRIAPTLLPAYLCRLPSTCGSSTESAGRRRCLKRRRAGSAAAGEQQDAGLPQQLYGHGSECQVRAPPPLTLIRGALALPRGPATLPTLRSRSLVIEQRRWRAAMGRGAGAGVWQGSASPSRSCGRPWPACVQGLQIVQGCRNVRTSPATLPRRRCRRRSTTPLPLLSAGARRSSGSRGAAPRLCAPHTRRSATPTARTRA